MLFFVYIKCCLFVCLFTNLYACLTQSKAFAQFFSHKSIRVMSFIKKSLQFIQLFQSEICTAPSMFERLKIIRKSITQNTQPLTRIIIAYLYIRTLVCYWQLTKQIPVRNSFPIWDSNPMFRYCLARCLHHWLQK